MLKQCVFITSLNQWLCTLKSIFSSPFAHGPVQKACKSVAVWIPSPQSSEICNSHIDSRRQTTSGMCAELKAAGEKKRDYIFPADKLCNRQTWLVKPERHFRQDVCWASGSWCNVTNLWRHRLMMLGAAIFQIATCTAAGKHDKWQGYTYNKCTCTTYRCYECPNTFLVVFKPHKLLLYILKKNLFLQQVFLLMCFTDC